MVNIKKVSIIALFLLIVGTVGSLLTFRTANKTESVSIEKVIDNQNITSVQLESDNAEVKIIPTNDTVAKVTLSGRGKSDTKQSLSAKVNGNTLSIKQGYQQFKFYTFDFVSTKLTLKVFLPEKQYNSIKIYNDNGLVELNNMKINRLTASTDNGRVKIKNITSISTYVESNNGQISLDHVDGKIKGITDNGKISLITKELNHKLNFESNNGSILIQTEKEPTNVTFNTHTDNGSINILGKYNGNAVIGNGDNLIELSTDNGSITVTK
ncbi:DUF4097 family beta strand repeat protein [Bacillus sp. RG28]|uniref:DUF4097 family beta strand repeat protein n=1 Tax=Gottfriedia endophytica TaxID=2820819 RepID=A0A940NM02_9BACI|nr:DUF4097 family beta strand repeat-containing protein [Gottfriedia endophytica]MBP0724986.1 DUF4097 family beta strand repeat protein [Gottfriedia endophytica]